jgi:hypothetical protein
MIQEPVSHELLRGNGDANSGRTGLEKGDTHTASDEKVVRNLGSIYTPPDFTQFLTFWAIQNPQDTILDVGIGEGAFTFAAYYRLLELGAIAAEAQQQIYGAEVDASTYDRFYNEPAI